jgi:putative membrane protein
VGPGGHGRTRNGGSDPDLRYPALLLALFVAIFIALGSRPAFREDWLLENLLVLVAVPVFVATARRHRFSNLAYTGLFLFLCVHEIGAHYTYSLVPWHDWWQMLTGSEGPPPARNHFDRVVHFLYGLLIYPLAFELFAVVASPRGAWRYTLPMFFLWSHAPIYEIIEWGAAALFGGDLGQAYLGTQGDIWDGQKDMALAMSGSLLAALLWPWVRRPA